MIVATLPLYPKVPASMMGMFNRTPILFTQFLKINKNLPSFDIVQSHDDEIELFEKVDRKFFDIFVMGNDIHVWVKFEDCLTGGQRL